MKMKDGGEDRDEKKDEDANADEDDVSGHYDLDVLSKNKPWVKRGGRNKRSE